MTEELKAMIDEIVSSSYELERSRCAERVWLTMVSLNLDQDIINLIMDAIDGNLYE